MPVATWLSSALTQRVLSARRLAALLPTSSNMSGSTMQVDSDDVKLQSSIDAAAQSVWKESQISKFQSGLDKIEDTILNKDPTDSAYYAMGSKLVAENSTVVQKVVSAAATTVNFKSIEDGIKSFAESSSILMKALDAVSQVHPAVAVVVLAFKAIVTLELKRRDNDHKVIVIQLKMKDMMTVLLDLRSIKDPKQLAPDGTTLEGRIQGLMGRIAKDIDECGNACQTYTRKHVLVKVLKSISWEGKLAGYADLFDQHRKDIAFAINMHTTLGVESANVKLESLAESVRAIGEGVNMINLFRMLDSPREKEIMELVRVNGGPKECMENDAVLKKLAASKASHLADSEGVVDPVKLDEVRKGLKEEVKDALKNNYALFEKKLELQKQQFIEEMGLTVKRESDRVITAITSGPHDRVVDKDLHQIWKEMNWRSSVKGRHFVLAVHDYFVQKLGATSTQDTQDHLDHLDTNSDNGGGTEISFIMGKAEVVDDDLWTLQYISLPRVPAILEAFDDDGSGFINVVEVNEFTSSRPQDWSLVHWIAYWAEGWHYTIWEYRNKICSILKGMYGLVDRVEIHPANQSFVDLYLNSSTLEELDRLIKSVTPYTEANTAVLEEKIRGYVDKEEERLKSNLQKVDWNIDGLDTLSLITGRGRIERYIFPLLYLVLRRHFWMLRLACQDTFPADVLQIPTQSISTLMSAVSTRIRNLSVVLKQRSADPSALVGNVAFGMFKLLNDSKLAVDELDDDSYLAEFGSGDIPEEELKSITQAGSLFGPLSNNSGYGEVESLKFDQDEFPEGDGILNGVWTGYNYYSDDDRSDGLMQFNIIHTEGSKLRGTGIDRVDVYHMEGEVTSTTENGLDFILKLAYGPQPSEGEETWAFEFTGSFDTSTLEARGNWASVGYPPFGPFLLTRRPTFAYPFLYSKSELSENRARARWKFALTTIRQQIRRQRWSWSYFKDRMEQRKRYVELRLRMDIEQLYNVNAAVRLSSDEILELNSTGERLHPADGRYYMSLAKKAMRMLCIHSRTNGLYCDGCYSGIIGQRMLCLECVKPDFSNHVDMCEFCIDDPASNNSFEHKSSHDSLLLFRALHDRKKKATVTNSKMFITAGKDALGSSDNKIECVSCSCPIEMPCWLCIEWECGCDAFVCATCQKKKDATYKKDSHKATHSLVRLSHNVAPSKQTVEETIGSLNSRLTEDLADVRSRVEKLEETVGGYEAKINQRITALEGMVEQRLSKMEELLLRVLTAVSLAESSG